MSRLLVTWRSRQTQRTYPVGVLVAGSEFEFSYLPGLRLPSDFRPFINFPRLGETYSSRSLFPFFAQRLMDTRRPDYPRYVEALGLPDDATDLQVLGRAGGRRKGDTVELVAEPEVTPSGNADHTFLVRGISHVPDSGRALQSVAGDSALLIVAQRDNPVNSAALQVCSLDGLPIGWVPDALLDFTHAVLDGPYEFNSVRVNGPDWPSHMRLLARLRGRVSPGFDPLAGLVDSASVGASQ